MSSPAATRQVPAGLLYALRVAIIAQAAALLVAASFAGQAVQSQPLAETHVMAGMVVHLVALVQLVLAVLVWRPGRGAGWPALASLALLIVGMAQHFTWEALGAHVPNGVLLFGLIAALLVWSWSPAAARRR
ncbi:hypothetical protein MF672_036585 [Actinomadura sp. ATCC 31491]|uniref:DoxX family protein n=1 Tax=Actinomadura luzonensis TaxID=2805427 RepID=A0ABT0G3U8_9ACTN|nr:hypothetical protein [Actinomadura luzonensis]MCK2219274.1 hypothetical protein [Actinomadura luzonensis]